MATKVSKKIPGNETITLIKGVSKKRPISTKKEVSKPLKPTTNDVTINGIKSTQA